jgi:hypothetical protein
VYSQLTTAPTSPHPGFCVVAEVLRVERVERAPNALYVLIVFGG